jgi:hypothetical protein
VHLQKNIHQNYDEIEKFESSVSKNVFDETLLNRHKRTDSEINISREAG